MEHTGFAALRLNESLVRALTESGYTTPTPIQLQAFPKVIDGRDLLGIAQTGTGKTAAFSLPLLHHLNSTQSESKNRPPRALIMAPTRELAIQISDSIKLYGKYAAFKQITIFGGVGQSPQVAALRRGIDLIVATPGRLLDLVNQGVCKLGHIEHFVLDEADRMLEMGFIQDVRKIVTKLPRKRQTLFFSATMPKTVSALAADLLYKPVNVSVAPQSTTGERINQLVMFALQLHKQIQLRHLLEDEAVTSAIVFTRTKYRANRVALALQKSGIAAEPIHSNKSQSARQRALGSFKAGKIKALVATDIAARGIDVDDVSHVINFELPNVSEDYIHRIGRTARAGAPGIAISLCAHDERPYLKNIEKLIKLSIPFIIGVEVKEEDIPPPEPRGPRPSPKKPSRRFGGVKPYHGAKTPIEPSGERKQSSQKPRKAGGQQKRPAGEQSRGRTRRSKPA